MPARSLSRKSRRGAILAAAVVAVLCPGLAEAEDRRPNVLFLLTDDQRADTIHALGNPAIETPNLDRLAESGLVFDNAYCMGSTIGAVCLPSRAMLLTGRSLFRLKAGGDPHYDVSFPLALRGAGYDTYHHGKSGNTPHAVQSDFEHNRYLDNDEAERRSGQPGKSIADAAVEFLAGRDSKRPFFMYLAFANPHDPRIAAPEWRDRYDETALPLPANYLPLHPFDNGEMTIRDERLAAWPRSEAEIHRHLADYYATITCLDAQIGRVLDALRESGEFDNTLIVFSSDQGIALGSHGLMGKQNLYDDSMAPPLIVAGPGIRPGHSAALVYLFDIFPTVCELVGIDAPEGIEGRSFAGVVRGEVEHARKAVLLAYRDVQRAVREKHWKLIRYPQVDQTQLFDLEHDPDELRNLAGDPDEAERVERMLALLAAMQQESGDTAPLKVDSPRDPTFTPPDGQVGYWKLRGDCRDYSATGNHGANHGVDLETGAFDGQDSHIEVSDAPSLRLGSADFSVAAWVHTGSNFDDLWGDVLEKYDPASRRGFYLRLGASAAGYNSTGDARHVQFGIDDGAPGAWIDCGRPGGKSHNSDALTVFEGDLYAGTTDAPDVADWAHVYRYRGGMEWEDCGRVGNGRTRGVYAMVVHDGALYAATSASHGPQPASMDFGRVYRYRGAQEWEDLGQPGSNYRLNCLASFRGRLYVCGFNIGPDPGHVYVYEGERRWTECGEFSGWPHTMAVHDGRLYTAYPRGEIYAYDGADWENLGNPFGTLEVCNQVHSLGVYQGELHAGTWPQGRIAVWRDGAWQDRGRPGDATEVIGLAVYGGSIYAGTIPRGEVFRFDGEVGWTSLRRLFDPPGFEPVPVGSSDGQGVADWSRATSLTVFDGRLFASTGTCYRTMLEHPRAEEHRGEVFAYQAGAHVAYDRDLGPGWKHLTAVRHADELRLYVDGELVDSAPIGRRGLDVSNDAPLRIGTGQVDGFHGRIREVWLYDRAIDAAEVRALAQLPDEALE